MTGCGGQGKEEDPGRRLGGPRREVRRRPISSSVGPEAGGP